MEEQEKNRPKFTKDELQRLEAVQAAAKTFGGTGVQNTNEVMYRIKHIYDFLKNRD